MYIKTKLNKGVRCNYEMSIVDVDENCLIMRCLCFRTDFIIMA